VGGSITCLLFAVVALALALGPVIWGLSQVTKGEKQWTEDCGDVKHFPNLLKAVYSMNLILIFMILGCACIYPANKEFAMYGGMCCVGIGFMTLCAVSVGSWILFIVATTKGASCTLTLLWQSWWKYYVASTAILCPLSLCTMCFRVLQIEMFNAKK